MAKALIWIFGILPSLLFFAWVDRNASLPVLPIWLGWPWIEGEAWSLGLRIVWNLGLFGGFAFLHSWLAHPPVKIRLESIAARVHLSARGLYVITAGLCLFVLMGIWQHTGVLVWSLNSEFFLAAMSSGEFGGFGVSSLIFLGLNAVSFWILLHSGIQTFLGLTPPVSSPRSNELYLGGLYRRMRHPAYFFTLLSFVLTPWMSLDRLLIVLATALYLPIGIRLEERKLLSEFGEKYRVYQSQVPAFFPWRRIR